MHQIAEPARRRLPDPVPFIFAAYALFMAWWFRVYWSSLPVPAVDLPGHLTAIEGLRANLWTFSYIFYDISCFTGYIAFGFYAWLAHWVCAIISLPLTWVAVDPVRAAAHGMMVAGAMLLPPAMTWAVRPLYEEFLGDDPALVRRARAWVALATCTFAFWFLNHDNQWYGIGAAAVMNIGLYSQEFGWHLAILHFGALARFIRDGRQVHVRTTGILFALLFLTHTMTAIWSFYLAFMSFAWFRERRGGILRAHVLGMALMAFWFVPMLAYLSSYTPLDIHRPQGDFLELLLRYPFFAYARTLVTVLKTGQLTLISAVEPTMVLLLTLLAFHRFTERARLLLAYMMFMVVALVLLTSGFIASSVPMGFHYYRFMAYMLLWVPMLLSVVPVYVLKAATGPAAPRWAEPFAHAGAVVVFGLGFISTAALPHNEYKKNQDLARSDYLANEKKVLEYFRNQPEKARVLTEYFSDYGKYPFLSCHWMSTRMYKETGWEVINGLFVQSSLAYHFPMGAANQLKANTYNGPLNYPAVTDLDDAGRVEQLRSFGITHLVIGGDEFFNKVKPFTSGDPVVIGPYRIVRIMDRPAPPVLPVTKRVAAYVDAGGKLPFKFMELYFWAKQKLSGGWEVLDATGADGLPPQVELIIVNGKPGVADERARRLAEMVKAAGGPEPRVVTVNFVSDYLLKHYGTWYQHNPEIDDFAEVGKFLDKEKLVEKVDDAARATVPPTTPGASFRWEPGNQAFELTGMTAGGLYRVNYSYVPYWSASSGARLLRGSADRTFAWAQADKASVSFSRFSLGSTWVGWMITLLALAWCWRDRAVHR